MYDSIDDVISMIDMTLDSKKKRHIVGGILISISLFFGGLAITTMTMHMEEEDEE